VHQVFPDLMHYLKNVIVTFFDLITGKGDTKKVRVTERELGRFCNSCPTEGKTETFLRRCFHAKILPVC